MTIILPKDIDKYRRKKLTIRIISYILLTVYIVLLLFFHGEEIFPLKVYESRLFMRVFKMCLYIFVILLPMWITGVPFKLFDSDWQGEIVKVHVKNLYRSESPYWFLLFEHNDIILTIKRDDGKTITRRAMIVGRYVHFTCGFMCYGKKSKYFGSIEHHLKDYEVGDRVAHFYGLKTIFVIKENKPERSKYCLACGTRNDQREEKCFSCGKSLLGFEQFDEKRKSLS